MAEDVTSEEWAEIGQRIRERREAKPWTQAELAAAVADIERRAGAAEGENECSSAVVAHVERGLYGISVSRLCAFGEALGIDAQTLVDGVL